MSETFEIFVFSYGRGAHLDRCLATISAHAPDLRVTIYDDGSPDEETRAVLAAQPRVVGPETARDGGARLGGLYGNMQRALDAAQAPYAIFLQDDAQLIRDVEPQDRDALAAWFQAGPRNAVADPRFLMGERIARRRNQFAPEGPGHVYREEGEAHIVRAYFTAICVLDVAKLRAVGWRFPGTERASADRARQHFGRKLQICPPFVAQMPEVPTLRFGNPTFGAWLSERRLASRVNWFASLDAAAVARLRATCGGPLPVAEDWLTPHHPVRARPFVHKAVNTWAPGRALNKIELTLRSLRKGHR